jgi:hypothetical protein
MPGTARVPDDRGRRSRHRCTATEQNLATGMLRVQLVSRQSSIDRRAAGPSPLKRKIPVDDFTPDEPAARPGMTVRVKYNWSGGAWRTREVRLSPTRLDDIPDSVIVTFRPEGGDIKVGVGLGRERVLTPVANGQEVDLAVPVGPVAIWVT